MKTPKIEEVREYFKDALEIKDNHGDILKMSKINKKEYIKVAIAFMLTTAKTMILACIIVLVTQK